MSWQQTAKEQGKQLWDQLCEKQSLWQHLQETEKPIVLYGMGDGADKIMAYLAGFQKKVQGVFASDDFVRGQSFRGYPVYHYQQAKEVFGDMVVLVAFGSQQPDVIQNICRIAAEQELYAPNVPLFGQGLFDLTFLAKHREEMELAYGLLADDASRHTFVLLCDYGISGKLSYLFACETPKSAGYALLQLGETEVFLDLGAYRGDTIIEFLQQTQGQYQKIVGVEPDEKNYRKLLQWAEDKERLICLPKGIWYRAETLAFQVKSGRNSMLSQLQAGQLGKNQEIGKQKLVEMTTIDQIQKEILPGAPISYIKMDVEGVEQNALLGGKETLRAYRPKLLVAGYHRNEDLFALPLLLKECNSEYQIYLRHHPYIPAWETNFYAV